MKRLLFAAGGAALVAGQAVAGGVDRSGQSVAALFETGNYGEFTFGSVGPSVSGVGAGTVPTPATPSPGVASGDMAPGYTQLGFAFKTDINDRLSAALIYDQPWGADTAYPMTPGYFAAGSTAELSSAAFTALLRFKLTDRFSLHGGVRYEQVSAQAFIPFITPVPGVTPPYEVTGSADWGWGYVAGAAFEIPQYALRVALTYNSEISHDLPTVESSVLGAGRSSTTSISMPQSVNLEFQTGLNPRTLLFGGVRWVNWDAFDITPADYKALTGGGSLVYYDYNTVTYTLGVGRRLTDTLSAALTVSHEPRHDGFSLNLGPTNGFTSIGLALSHQTGKVKITGGVRYVMLGDAETTLGGGVAAARFSGNSALAAGVKVGFNF